LFNKVILIGRLVWDPELKHTPDGTAVTKIRLAVDRDFKNAQGETEADFIDVVCWRKTAENVAQHLSKGRLTAVEGRLQIRSYDDSNGIRRIAAEVVSSRVKFLPDGKKNGVEAPPLPDDAPPAPSGNSGSDFPSDFGSEISFNENDVPF